MSGDDDDDIILEDAAELSPRKAAIRKGGQSDLDSLFVPNEGSIDFSHLSNAFPQQYNPPPQKTAKRAPITAEEKKKRKEVILDNFIVSKQTELEQLTEEGEEEGEEEEEFIQSTISNVLEKETEVESQLEDIEKEKSDTEDEIADLFDRLKRLQSEQAKLTKKTRHLQILHSEFEDLLKKRRKNDLDNSGNASDDEASEEKYQRSSYAIARIGRKITRAQAELVRLIKRYSSF